MAQIIQRILMSLKAFSYEEGGESKGARTGTVLFVAVAEYEIDVVSGPIPRER